MENNQIEDRLNDATRLVLAGPLKRLANYIVDIIIFSFVFAPLLAIASAFIPGLQEKLKDPAQMGWAEQALIFFIYCFYLAVCEAIFKGKTPAKFITKTRAVYLNGRKINSQTAFLRSLLRMIPFEQLTALIGMPPRPFHDRFSATVVVNEDASQLPDN